MTGWVSEREDVDWKPLLAKTPQFEVFVSRPKGMEYYVEPCGSRKFHPAGFAR